MSIQDTYNWAKEKAEHWLDTANHQSFPLDPTTKTMSSVCELKFSNDSFFGDVAIRDGDLFFHFFATSDKIFNRQIKPSNTIWTFRQDFLDALTDAFVATFKHAERLFVDFVPELQSYVVRCAGFGDNPLYSEMIERTLVKIKEKYER